MTDINHSYVRQNRPSVLFFKKKKEKILIILKKKKNSYEIKSIDLKNIKNIYVITNLNY